MEKRLNSIGLRFSFLDAIAGYSLSNGEIERVYARGEAFRRFKRPLSREEIGCYLSHRAAWARVAASGAKGALILEDDACCDERLGYVLERIESRLADPLIIKLYGPSRPRPAIADEAIDGMFRCVRPLVAPPFTIGYVISAPAARRLSERPARFARPVDLDLKHWWEHGNPVWGVVPDLVTPSAALGSSIAAARRRASDAPMALRFLRNSRYQIRFHAALARAMLAGGLSADARERS